MADLTYTYWWNTGQGNNWVWPMKSFGALKITRKGWFPLCSITRSNVLAVTNVQINFIINYSTIELQNWRRTLQRNLFHLSDSFMMKIAKVSPHSKPAPPHQVISPPFPILCIINKVRRMCWRFQDPYRSRYQRGLNITVTVTNCWRKNPSKPYAHGGQIHPILKGFIRVRVRLPSKGSSLPLEGSVRIIFICGLFWKGKLWLFLRGTKGRLIFFVQYIFNCTQFLMEGNFF